MAICIAVTKANLGGAQRYVESLARLLVSERMPTTVVAGEGGQLLPRLAAANVDILQFEGLGNSSIVADLRFLAWMAMQVRRRRFHQLVFNSTKLLPVAWILSLIFPWARIHYVCHGFPFVPGSGSLADKLKKAAFFGMLRNIRSIICVSGYVQSLVRGNLSTQSNVVLATNTIEPSVALGLAKADDPDDPEPHATRFNWSGGGLRVVPARGTVPFRAVSLAEINVNKGIDALCRALAPYRDVLSGHFEWHVYGEGKDRMLVEGLVADEGLAGIVMLHGFREDARNLMKDFDVLLIPSRNEAFGMVALEAAASGVFVFGTAVGGIPEAILSEEHGCTFKDVEDLAGLLAALTSGGMRPLPPGVPTPAYWERRYRDWCDVHLKLFAR